MIYLAHHVNSRSLDLRPNFDIDLLRSTMYAGFDASQRDEYDAVQIMLQAVILQKLFATKTCLPNKHYFTLSWPL